MRALILIGLFAIVGCASAPVEPKPCTNVYTPSVDGEPVHYIGNDGKDHKCSVGHCKGAIYNGCSGSAELCCTKE